MDRAAPGAGSAIGRVVGVVGKIEHREGVGDTARILDRSEIEGRRVGQVREAAVMGLFAAADPAVKPSVHLIQEIAKPPLGTSTQTHTASSVFDCGGVRWIMRWPTQVRFLYCSHMPYERPYRDPRQKLILDDLWAADAIEIVCKGCGRQSVLATHEMHARFRDTVALEVIVAKVRCSACGGKDVMWQLLRARPPMSARGY